MGFLLCRQQKQFYTPQHLSGIRRGPPVASCFHPGQGRSMSAQHTFILNCSTIQQQLHTHTHRATHSNGVAQDIYAELFTASHLMNTCCMFSFCLKLSSFLLLQLLIPNHLTINQTNLLQPQIIDSAFEVLILANSTESTSVLEK